MNTVNPHARRAKGVVTMMPEGRGLREWLPPKGRVSTAVATVEYTGGADVTDLVFIGARRWHRYEPRNSIPPFGASPARTLKGDNRNQQVTKKEIWMLALVDHEGRQWVSHTDSRSSMSL